MMPAVGVIGLGVLGSAVAQRLLQSGFEVTGYDIAAAPIERLATMGLAGADSPAGVADRAAVVITCLPTVEALHAALSGPRGLREGTIRPLTVVEISTLPIAEKERARDRLAERGIDALDCPVSGNRLMALAEGVTAFASGDGDILERARPVLDGFCREVHHVGPFGDGMKVKLCGNILNLVHNTVAAEVMTLARRSGLDAEMFHRVISGSGSSSRMFEVRGRLMVDEDYAREGMNFSVPMKDSRIITGHAADLHVPIPLYTAALQLYHAAVAQGFEDEDAAAVCKVYEGAAGMRPARSGT